MRNLKITLEYDGTRYFGWQTQRNEQRTIQATVEKSLRTILSEKVRVIGSGRTDAGVHALAQVANFKTRSQIPLKKLRSAMNALLPKDIAVTGVEEAAPDFDACRNARSKTYRYVILNSLHRSGFLKERAAFCSFPLDAALMRRESRSLVGRHDFKAFCAGGSNAKTTVRTVKSITVKKISCGMLGAREKSSCLIAMDIEADGFLYNMVRNIVGSLIEAGRGRFPAGSLKKILSSKERRLAGPTAVACGLYLKKVTY
jgi:tRNA pseudouridine38-40 synthase